MKAEPLPGWDSPRAIALHQKGATNGNRNGDAD